MIRNKLFFIVLILLIMDLTNTEDYEDYAKRNRRRRPQQHQQQYNSGPCSRLLGLSYINFNYNIDCSGAGHGSLGTPSDFQGGHGSHGTYSGGGFGNADSHRPQKPHRPFGGGQGTYGPNQGGLFNRPIWGALGSLASNFGSSFTNDLGSGGGGGGAGIFDGSIIQSFSSLFSHNSDTEPQRPIVTNRPPIPTLTSTPSGVDAIPTDSQTIVPIVDLRPVHEEYYDEVTEANIYGGSKKLTGAHYVAGFGNYNRVVKKFNRQFNHALNYFFKR